MAAENEQAVDAFFRKLSAYMVSEIQAQKTGSSNDRRCADMDRANAKNALCALLGPGSADVSEACCHAQAQQREPGGLFYCPCGFAGDQRATMEALHG